MIHNNCTSAGEFTSYRRWAEIHPGHNVTSEVSEMHVGFSGLYIYFFFSDMELHLLTYLYFARIRIFSIECGVYKEFEVRAYILSPFNLQ